MRVQSYISFAAHINRMAEGFDDTTSHSLADVMDKKPEEELVEKLQKTVADLREQAEEEQVGETPGAPHYSHCNGILRACKRIEEEFNL